MFLVEWSDGHVATAIDSQEFVSQSAPESPDIAEWGAFFFLLTVPGATYTLIGSLSRGDLRAGHVNIAQALRFVG